MRYEKCSFPECKGNYIPAQTGKLKLCPKHAETMRFIIWILENIKIKDDKKTDSKIILPE